MMVLKRMDDAIRDGDTIRAVIRSTAINQDGRTPGITQPSIKAQTDNIQQAYQAADLSLEYTRYFEAHGTGTAVGDPFEAEAIHTAFQRKLDNPLYIGTLKASIGHLEAGAGIAAMIKSVLVLENGILPPNAGFERHNPAIPVEDWSLRVGSVLSFGTYPHIS
jgi:acyl transferase domain-containing protein